MAKSRAADSITAPHVVAVPYPGRGHVNPMLLLGRLLASRLSPYRGNVTVVITEEWLGLLGGASSPPPGVRFRTVPNVIPSENGRAADFLGFLQAVYTKLEAPFERLLDELEPPATAILADTFLPWAVDVGNRRKLPVCSLFTMSASFFSALLHFHRLPFSDDQRLPFDASGNSEVGDEPLSKYIPGHSCVRLSDLSPFLSMTKPFELALQAISQAKKAQHLIFTTAYELEPRIIDALRAELPFPVHVIGPTIPYLTLQETDIKIPDDDDLIAWLNSQPQSSVLYVSLGSFLSVPRSQMDEIALGLQASNARFLWVARGDSSRLREMVGRGGRGLVVPWCDQLKVLLHPSVGGFLTHCGWNSTMEAAFAGVPMLTFPIIVDQPVDSRIVVDVWKVGMRLRGDMMGGEVVGRERVADLVNRLMDLEGAERREMRKRASRLKEACRGAVNAGGSSIRSLHSLAESLSLSDRGLSSSIEGNAN
ncbi:hypothetical protein HPP92_007307 [Vanilla planifolia]|uniref:Glycosyltransferase n=1 Tax=Vanilla planifolia TaxID=51239 RepID=A0A835RIC7_VANPL|nr:hypothetical protein HPP92_007511 [Vanilla planifolia]KAG0490444.1 hypothetical protein HPP92_007307 [Vanilla planifolia]